MVRMLFASKCKYNAKLHTPLVTRQKLLELRLGCIVTSTNNPNLVPSDYHLFRFLQNSLNSKHFNDADDVKSHLIQFCADKN